MPIPDFTPREAASFLFGYFVARKGRVNKKIQPHITTAYEVISGGTYRGPLVVYQMQDAAKQIFAKACAKPEPGKEV